MTSAILSVKGRQPRGWKSTVDGRLGWGTVTALFMLTLCVASALAAHHGPAEYHDYAIMLTRLFFVATAVVGASSDKDIPPLEGPRQ